jgi:hypothetical protein
MNKLKSFATKLYLYIPYQYFLNFLHKVGLWKPKIDLNLENHIYKFIKINKNLWKNNNVNNDQSILVEGHLSNYGINYLFRSAITALSIQELKKYSIKVLYPGFDYQWFYSKKIYKSFGINDFIYIRNKLFFFGIINRLICLHKIQYFKKIIQNPEDIISLKFENIIVGDLIYDDILKKFNLKTILEIDSNVFHSIIRAYKLFLDYNYFFKKNHFKYYVTTHTAYSEYGILCRVALKYNIIVIETTDIQTSIFKNITDNNLPTYHQGIINLIQDYKSNNTITDSDMQDAKINLIKRMDAHVQQIDVQKAYRGKLYSRNDLLNILNLDDSKKNVFIFAHIFTDSPHTSSGMLFSDYYIWLKETLIIISNIKDVNWIIKPHPATSLYNEEGIIENLIDLYSSSNICICPNDFNTKSIIDCADVIVTVHGTAGLEFACLGIPVILTGKPFYSSFGFTIEPTTILEYKFILMNVSQQKKLTNFQISKALEILYIWNTQFDWNNPIITLDILQDIWGSERERNLVNAFMKITENIQKYNVKDLTQWNLIKNILN